MGDEGHDRLDGTRLAVAVIFIFFAACATPDGAEQLAPKSKCYTAVRQLGDGKDMHIAIHPSYAGVGLVSDDEISFWSKDRSHWRRERPNPSGGPLREVLLLEAYRESLRVVSSNSWLRLSLETGQLTRLNGVGSQFCLDDGEANLLSLWKGIDTEIKVGRSPVSFRHGESKWWVSDQAVTRFEPEEHFPDGQLWRCGQEKLYLEMNGKIREIEKDGALSETSRVIKPHEVPFVANSTGNLASARLAGRRVEVGEVCFQTEGEIVEAKFLDWGFVTLEQSAKGKAAQLYRFPKLNRVTPCEMVTDNRFPRIVKPAKAPTIKEICNDPFDGF